MNKLVIAGHASLKLFDKTQTRLGMFAQIFHYDTLFKWLINGPILREEAMDPKTRPEG